MKVLTEKIEMLETKLVALQGGKYKSVKQISLEGNQKII